MRMPPEILTRILAGEHLNVPTRQALGLWPLETLRYSEVVEHLAQVLASSDWFPRAPPAIKPGETIHEGIFIHRESERRYSCLAQRHHAIVPSQLAERVETVFESPHAAAEYYLKWELLLPGKLDGWRIE